MSDRLALALACALHSAAAAAAPPPASSPVGHRDLVAEHAALGPATGVPPAVPAPQPWLLDGAVGAPAVSREVWGYLPYWSYSASAPYAPARWDLLTVLAWFCVEMDASGEITDWHGWGGATTAALVAQARAHGVAVAVTVTNFDGDEIAALLASPTARATAIASLLDAMDRHGADGVNVDFEFVPRSAREDFVSFMAELKQAVAAVAPGGGEGHVSLAGPSVDWSGAYDYDALLAATDGIMVMAYGYYWSGGNPGPTSPLYGGAPWSKYAIDWTVDDYLTYGGEEQRHKVVIGLPWYGRSWAVPAAQAPTTALGSGATLLFRDAEAEVDGYGRLFEEQTRSTYYHKTVGGQLRQAWFDDRRSFGEKVAYVDAMDLGGVGIWALGYEGGYDDLWAAIDEVLVDGGPEDPVEPGPEPLAEPGPEALAEPGPEALAEPGPDAGAEADGVEAEDDDVAGDAQGHDAGADGPDAALRDTLPGSGGEHRPPELALGPVRRDVHAESFIDAGGCAGASTGARGAPAWPAIALAALALWRRGAPRAGKRRILSARLGRGLQFSSPARPPGE